MLAQSMRPKCKAEIHYTPMSDGVYLRGNNSRLILKGKSLYPLLKHLVPNLNGDVTLEEITEGLDADRKRMVTNLLEKLFAHDFLKDTSQDQLHRLNSVELETYASNITFIESFQTSAAYRFESFRNKRLLLIGSGLSFTSLIQASFQCGVKQVHALMTTEDEISSRAPHEMLALFAGSPSEQKARLIDTPSWDNEAEVCHIIQTYDAILHIAEQPGLARAGLLNKLCIEQGKTLIQAILMDDHAWVGPLVSPETGNCWECAWRRLQANLTDLPEHLSRDKFYNQPSVSTDRSLAMPEATVIANRLLFALFQSCTQTNATETTGKLSMIDRETFLSESHAFLPHPHCLACQHPVVPTASEFLEQIQRLQQQGPVDPDVFLENVAECVDKRLGLFSAVDADHFVQVPLAVYKMHLSNPLFKKLQPNSLSVTAVSTDTRCASIRVAQKACEYYAANVVDQRRLLSSEMVQQHSLPAIAASQLLGKESLPLEDEMWTWALDLQTHQASLVPTTHVFQRGRGIASGMIWEEALCQALLDWCNELTVEQLKDTQQAYRQVDLERTPMTPEGAHLYRLLKAAVGQVVIYDVTGILHVPTFAACLEKGRVVAYSTHCDGAQALRMGLEQTLRQYQSEQFQQSDYALAPVPDLPLNLRSDQLSVPSYTLPDAWPTRLAWLLQQLQANGLRAFAIPLDHDPTIAQISPFIVRVLLSRRELKWG